MSAFGGKADMAYCTAKCPLLTQRWGNRPALLWIAEDLGAALQADGETRSVCTASSIRRRSASHGPFCWIRRFGQADERLHCG